MNQRQTIIVNPSFNINDGREKENQDLGECTICIESLNQNKIVKLKCGHIFHFDCISQCVNCKCPLCRSDISKDKICYGCVTYRTPFYFGSYKKNGQCIHCGHKSFKSYLKKLLIRG